MKTVMPEKTLSKIKNRILTVLRLPRNRPYLISCLILVFSAILIGLDNPTGIIVGWLAVIVVLVAMARRWWTPWYFLILLVGSFLGAILLSFIYMVVALPLAEWISGPNVESTNAWRIFHMVISNLILLFVPMGMFFGAVGFIICGAYRLLRLIRRKLSDRGT
jgi:uncharacterized membrane protein